MRVKFLVLVLFAFLLAVVLTPVIAQNVPTVVSGQFPVGQIGGVTSAAVFNSGNLYFNVGPRIARLAVLNTAPLTPTLPAAYSSILPGVPQDIKAANGYLYVALGKGGVAVIDPATLQVLSAQTLPVTATAAAVAVGSQQLYVAAENDGVIGYDLGLDKKTLTYAQTKSFTSPVRRITDVEVRSIAGSQYLFVSANNFANAAVDRGGVMKFNITSGPTLGSPSATLQLDINALAVTDAFVYAAGDTDLYALDTNQLGATGGVSSTVALTFRGLRISLRPGDANAYVSTAVASVDVVGISAPPPGSAPTMAVIGSLATADVVLDVAPVQFPSDTNTYLYLANYGSGLSIASAPQITPENVNLDRPSYVMPQPGLSDVVAGTYPQAFVNSIPSMQWTVNTSNLNALNVAGPGLIPPSQINALTPYTNSLLASGGPDGLLRYLVNPGSDLTYSDTVGTGGIAFDAAVAWPNAIVADGAHGLTVIDLSDPFSMTLTGNAPSPTGGEFTRVAVQSHYAYVADNGNNFDKDGALRIYDLTDPTTPSATGSVSQTGILDVQVNGNLAFLAVGAQGIRVADVTNPAAPIIISTDDYTGTTSAQSLVVFKHFLFVASGDAGVQMLSFDQAGQLSLIATIPTGGSAVQLAQVPGQLYVADDTGGLFVIQVGTDLAVSKTAPVSAYAGQDYTYSLQVNNVGEAVATGVIITDVLPAEVSLVSAQNCATGGGTVTCTVPSLAVGASTTFSVVVKSTADMVINNTAVVASNEFDLDLSNNSSMAATQIVASADIALSKTESPSPAIASQPMTYTLVVNNVGPSTATNVVLTDTLPAQVQFTSTSGGACSGTSTVVCNLSTLSAGSVTTVTIVVVPTVGGVSLNNSAVVMSDVYDPNLANNSAGPVVTPVKVRLYLPLVHR